MDDNSPLITVPSWVIEGTYTENLRFLEDKKEVAGVELLFFIYDNDVKNQLDLQWEEIRRYGERFVFTCHLPDSLLPVHEELVARLAPPVRHFIVHPAVENRAGQIRLIAEWEKRYGIPFLTENTKPGLLEARFPMMETNAGLCMDTGHLLLEGKNPAEFFEK
jgi:sugar phosphate isomerase/epimerase